MALAIIAPRLQDLAALIEQAGVAVDVLDCGAVFVVETKLDDDVAEAVLGGPVLKGSAKPVSGDVVVTELVFYKVPECWVGERCALSVGVVSYRPRPCMVFRAFEVPVTGKEVIVAPDGFHFLDDCHGSGGQRNDVVITGFDFHPVTRDDEKLISLIDILPLYSEDFAGSRRAGQQKELEGEGFDPDIIESVAAPAAIVL